MIASLLRAAEGLGSWFLETTLHGTLVVLVVALVQASTGRFLTARLRHALWIVAAVTLVLPARFPVPVPVPRALVPGARTSGAGRTGSTVARAPVAPGRAGLGTNSGRPSPRPGAARTALGSARRGGPGDDRPFPWRAAVGGLWLAGCAWGAARVLRGNRKLAHSLRALPPLADPRLERLAAECARELGLRRLPALVTSGGNVSPALTGWLAPRLVLPREVLVASSLNDLRHVLLHELAHFGRCDVLWNWAFESIRVLHWPNPLVRWTCSRARQERELACDEVVAGCCRPDEVAAYGRLLLRLACLVPPRAAGVNPAVGADSRRFLKRRITMLASPPRRGRWCSAAGIGLLASCAFVGLTALEPREPGSQEVSSDRGGAPEPDEGSRCFCIHDVGWAPEEGQDFEAPRLGLQMPSAQKEPPPDGSSLRQRHLESLREFIRATVSPETWKAESRIEVRDGQLLVDAPRSVHDEIAALVAGLARTRVVHVEIRLVPIEDGTLGTLPRSLGRAVRLALFQRAPRGVPLGDEDVRVLERLEAEGQGLLKSAPSVVLLDAQRAHVLVVHEAAVIADLKRVETDGKTRFEPVVGVLRTGFVIRLEAAVSGDGRHVALALRLDAADAATPIRAVAADTLPRFRGVEGAGEMFIQVPELRTAELETTLSLPDGSWVLAGSLSPLAGEVSRPGRRPRAGTLVVVRTAVHRRGESSER